MLDTYILVKEAAKRLLVSPYSIRRYIKQGRLKAVKFGRNYLVVERTLDNLLKKV